MSYKLLDLFSGPGGAAFGYYKAGFEDITGVDNEQMKQYPFKHIYKDVFKLDISFIKEFDFIHASPPCQAYSIGSESARQKGKVYPDLVEATRQLLIDSGKPYIIENVPNAPLINPIILCGTQFNLKVFRHRLFETNIKSLRGKVNKCNHTGLKVKYTMYGEGNMFGVAGKQYGNKDQWNEAMGGELGFVPSKRLMAQVIPPAYTEFLGKQVIKYLDSNLKR